MPVVVGLLVLGALLTPGTCYVFRRDTSSPGGSPVSAVREVARLVAVSLLCDYVAVLLFFVAHHVHIRNVPNPWAVLRDPAGYFHAHPLRNVGWAGVFVLVASLVAVLLAWILERPWVHSLLRRPSLSWLLSRSARSRAGSG